MNKNWITFVCFFGALSILVMSQPWRFLKELFLQVCLGFNIVINSYFKRAKYIYLYFCMIWLLERPWNCITNYFYLSQQEAHHPSCARGQLPKILLDKVQNWWIDRVHLNCDGQEHLYIKDSLQTDETKLSPVHESEWIFLRFVNRKVPLFWVSVVCAHVVCNRIVLLIFSYWSRLENSPRERKESISRQQQGINNNSQFSSVCSSLMSSDRHQIPGIKYTRLKV